MMNRGGDIMEGGAMVEASGGGIMEEASWTRQHGRDIMEGGIMEEACRGGIMDEESWISWREA